MRKITISPDAAETMLEDIREMGYSGNPEFVAELRNAVENNEEIEKDIPESVLNDIIGSALGVDDFSIDELSGISGISDFYQNRIEELKSKVANGEMTIDEFEREVEKLVEKQQENRHKQDSI